MKSEICVLEEPKLVFGDGNKLTDPHAGLSLFGPYDKGELGRPHEVSYALVGGASGLRASILILDAFGRHIRDLAQLLTVICRNIPDLNMR